MKKLLIIILFFNVQIIDAQILTGASARFNDAFVEWDIQADDSDERSELTMTWQNPDNWGQWSYRIGDKTGTIKTKWINDFSHWEIRGDNKIITAQMTWAGDVRQWRVTDNNFSFDLKCRWGNNFNEWVVDDAKRGKYLVAMDIENDPRDWIIEDDLDESVSLQMKMTLLFLSIFNSVPKN